MKNLLTTIFVIVGISANAQTSGTVSSFKYNPTLVHTGTHIQMSFRPTIRDTSHVYTIKEVFYGMSNMTLAQYDFMVANTERNCDGCKFIDVRVTLYGKDHDFTFEEFRKLVYDHLTKAGKVL